MDNASPSRSTVLRMTGAAVSIFSLILGLLVMFASPNGCSFVASLALVILSLLFITGGIVFLIGQILSWREHRLKPA